MEFSFPFPFPKIGLEFSTWIPVPEKMGMEFAISRSRSRSPKVIPAHGWLVDNSVIKILDFPTKAMKITVDPALKYE